MFTITTQSLITMQVLFAALCQEWLKAMPSCHYRILSHARYTHASGKLHACDDTVATHVWQGTRMHWACDTHAMNNVHACMMLWLRMCGKDTRAVAWWQLPT